MISRVFQSGWEIAQRWFPDRQIYHRSDGQVRYFEIKTEYQLGALLAATVLTGWLCFATVSVAFQGHRIASRMAEVETIRLEANRMVNEARASELAATNFLDAQMREFDRTAVEFQARHETLRQLIDLAEQMEGSSLSSSPALGEGRILMAATPADPSQREARDAITLTAYDPDDPEARIEALIAQQDAVLSEAEDASEARLENLRAVLRLTGLRLDDVLEEGRGSETGGPFLAMAEAGPFARAAMNPNDAFSSRIARIAARMVEAEELEAAVLSLPLGEPVGVAFRETSPFGYRIDPFTGRPAFHSGQDFVAYPRAPIVSTGPGRVIYAGWRSGYGRTVEIDHGYGFVTRYGHMTSIDVRRGDQVERGQRIGAMGSTGRSTATHLHYEVIFRNDQTDPERFLRAGQYVQQQG
jgi:murein DD-endopeptidase MepM/ murein hydrolase activator NlpD